MSTNIGDTPRGLNGTYRSYALNYPAPYENLFSTPIALTTASQNVLNITIISDMLGGTTPSVYKLSQTPFAYFGGYATDAGTVSFKFSMNGTQKGTGSKALAAGQYYTFSLYYNNCMPVKVNDVFTIDVWLSSAVNVTCSYVALGIAPTRIIPVKEKRYLADFKFDYGSSWPTLTLGTPYVNTSGTIYPQTFDITLNTLSSNPYPLIIPYTTFGVSRYQYADNASGFTAVSDATYMPRYYNTTKINTISFRPSIDV